MKSGWTLRDGEEVLVSTMRLLYEAIYRIVQIFHVPIAWVFGSKQDLLDGLLDSGCVPPGRAIDLGCGAGVGAIYLATKGFDVTGLDFSPTAIKLARDRARAAGVEATFLKDDLTDLRYVNGTFDLLMDFGALNDLNQKERDLYMNNVLPLSHLGSHYILMCFENKLTPEEVERRFGEHFSIETLVRKSESVFSRTIAIYLMTRNQSG